MFLGKTLLKRNSLCWFGPSLPQKTSNCNLKHLMGTWACSCQRCSETMCGPGDFPSVMCSVRKVGRKWSKNARSSPEITVELSLQRGSKCWCRKKLSEEILHVTELLKPLIFGIYFSKSNFSNGNLTTACTDMSRLNPGVPAAVQTFQIWVPEMCLGILSICYWSHQQGPHLPLV